MERIDELQRGGYRLIQDPDKFCFGTDAVLLADFAKARRGERVIDLCSGSGVVPLLMLARYPGARYTALEIQPDIAAMARRSMALNQVQERVQVITGDLRSLPPQLRPHSFHVVTVNPPYMPADGRRRSANQAVQIARSEVCCTLTDVVRAAAALLTDKGRLYMVHRPQRLVDIFEAMLACRIEPKRLQWVHPYADKEPTQVLIEGVLGGGRELRVTPPLITYEAPGVYTKPMLEVYGQDGHHSDMS